MERLALPGGDLLGMRCWSPILAGVLAASTAIASLAAEPAVDLGPVAETHAMVPMRDGTKLSTYPDTPQMMLT